MGRKFKFKFPDGRDPRSKNRALAGALSFLFLVMVLTYSHDINNPDSCALCHVMVPHVRTWEASAHNNLSCLTCHQEPGLEGVARFQASLAQMGYKYLTETYYLPITTREKMTADGCYNCHALNREVTPSGDLIVPHYRHEDVNIDCMECHQGVVHTNISTRDFTLSTNVEQWTAAFASTQMAYEYRNLDMKECMDCHEALQADNSCEACHQVIVYPDSHNAPNFMTDHGRQAYQDLESCDFCHSWTRRNAEEVEHSDPVAAYARENSLCYECHLQRPEGHDERYRLNHAKDARINGTQGCMVCHNVQLGGNNQGEFSNITPVNCSNCHQGRHRDGWRIKHPTPVENGLEQDCLRCHSPRVCGDCHYIKK
ncbi:cytochrome c3 family protein [Dethiobacter alkaliphilus]|uniref:Cytochrome c, NapC/NirT family n=1 Tax=Dethiobacter alkaliphilus AHT 1 TaxID=555088 RepID=C0GF38_DETAL|nr:cytochrome c3 family protein [Dethiobacter alkaliphilus]EEG78220.1 cytochrome c, NapC/NirT family [Dethiobacter alkaliphilus AHT 1]